MNKVLAVLQKKISILMPHLSTPLTTIKKIAQKKASMASLLILLTGTSINNTAVAEPDQDTNPERQNPTTEITAQVQIVEQERYVSDRLALQLRSGPSSRNRIVKTLRSGNKLTVTKIDKETGYSFVRLPSGTEGWVLSRFLIEGPTANIKLQELDKQLNNLSAELKQTKQRLTAANDELKKLRKERSGFERDASKLSKELDYVKTVSANAISLDDKAKKLTTRNQELEIQVEALTVQNDELKSDIQTSYILYGGGLVFAGILAGLLLPSFRGRRSNSGWA